MRRNHPFSHSLAVVVGGVAFLVGGLAGCGGSPGLVVGGGDSLGSDGEPLVTGTSVLALTSDILGDTDVAELRYTIQRVACEGEIADPSWAPHEVIKPLEDMVIPAHIPALENRPFDAGSGHLFADHFQRCDAGCYDIHVQPLNIHGGDSEDCAAAGRRGIEVVDGATTEILLIHQCEGPEGGGKDVIAAINHPPTIWGFTYDPSKFVFECEFVTLCATAQDPDNDPLEFVWHHSEGPDFFLDPVVIEDSEDNGRRTQCVHVVPQEAGSYAVSVAVYDLAQIEGELVRIEDVLADYGGGGDSHDSLLVPLHVNWDVELECFDGHGRLVRRPGTRIPDRHARCPWVTPEDYYCDPDKAPVERTCPGGHFDPHTVYPRCDGDPPPEPPECDDCEGRVDSLTMRWLGDHTVTITIKQHDRAVVFEDEVEPGEEFSFEGTHPPGIDGGLGDHIWIRVDGRLRHDLRTDCTWDLGPSAMFGDFVVGEASVPNGQLCEAGHDD